MNAASDGALSTHDLYRRVGTVLDTRARMRHAAFKAAPGLLSPFDLSGNMVLDTSRAKALGYRFGQVEDWIDDTIRQHDLAFIGAEAPTSVGRSTLPLRGHTAVRDWEW